MSKRIVLIGPMYPYRGGIAHFFETMYWGLRERGHHVDAVTFSRQYPSLLFPGKSQFELGATPARAVPAERWIDSINPATWFSAVSKIAQSQPDVAIFKYWIPFLAPAFGRLARSLSKRGIQQLVVVDNALPHERRWGDRVLGRYFFKAMDGCVVMSSAVERDLDLLKVSVPRVFAPHPVYDVFGQPVDRKQARDELGIPQEAPLLLFFGFVRRYKGLDILLRSMPKVLRAMPDARLVVAGEFYDDEADYRNLISSMNLDRNVTVHARYIPKEMVAKYFAAANVVVQPYVSATQSGVAQIAYQFDRPLIVTDVGGLAEVIPHEVAGLVVKPNDPNALAESVIRFFSEALEDQLVAGVQEQKQKYSWGQLLDALESLMSSDSRTSPSGRVA